MSPETWWRNVIAHAERHRAVVVLCAAVCAATLAAVLWPRGNTVERSDVATVSTPEALSSPTIGGERPPQRPTVVVGAKCAEALQALRELMDTRSASTLDASETTVLNDTLAVAFSVCNAGEMEAFQATELSPWLSWAAGDDN